MLDSLVASGSPKACEEYYVCKKWQHRRSQLQNCGKCPYLKPGPSFDFRGKDVHVNLNMSCYSKIKIYVIICAGCNKIYIGETGTPQTTHSCSRIPKKVGSVNILMYADMNNFECWYQPRGDMKALARFVTLCRWRRVISVPGLSCHIRGWYSGIVARADMWYM